MKLLVVLIGIVALAFIGIYPGRSASGAGSETYKQNAKGLEKEFEPFLRAYSKGDVAAQDQAFAVFQFADGKAWFGQYFQPGDVEQLVWDAESEVEGERNTLRTMMGLVARGARFHANCKPHAEDKDGSVKPRESRVNPLKPLPVEQFNIEMQAEGTEKRFSFLGNFVYENGAYRYVGKGAFPFWSMPDANDPKKH